MNEIKEKKLNYYPEIVSLESSERIIYQMKNNIVKIYLNNESKGTGFFCRIPYINNKELNVLITNNYVINLELDKIIISINNDNEIKEIELKNRIKYTNKEYDITIIEIKEEDNINNYLEIDENIMKKDKNIIYINNSIYILQYPRSKKLGVSYGILKGIYEDKKYNFNHICSTEEGSSGSPIINLINNKVIGIQKESNNQNSYNVGLFLNYAIEDFIYNINNKYIIKELNERFNLNLNDTENLEKLKIRWKGINIDKLDKMRIDNLKELDLSNNDISDIKVLEKVKFENLEKLDLSHNQISDIKVLKKVKFENLEILDLSWNEISDIKILEKVKFENLKELYLYNNKISDIKVLEIVKFENLEILKLSGNQISDIKVLEKVKFENLEILYLSFNNISDIKVLEKVKFENLNELYLSVNKISDIKVLEKVKFGNLEKLDLSVNKISDIKVLEKIKFENLKVLDLSQNQINKNEYSSLIDNLNYLRF